MTVYFKSVSFKKHFKTKRSREAVDKSGRADSDGRVNEDTLTIPAPLRLVGVRIKREEG